MARYARRRKTVRPFRNMRKARMYRSAGLASFGRRLGGYAINKMKNAVHWFRKEIKLSDISDPGSGAINGVQFFQASTIPDWSDLADNYDQYLVKKIIYTFEPQFSGTNTAGVAPYQRWMRVVHDYNDGTALSTESEYLSYNNCKSYLCARPKPIRVVLYPRLPVAVQAYAGGASFSQNKKPGWLNTSAEASQVPMYGIKYYVPSLAMAQFTPIFKVRATVVVGFKNTR